MVGIAPLVTHHIDWAVYSSPSPEKNAVCFWTGLPPPLLFGASVLIDLRVLELFAHLFLGLLVRGRRELPAPLGSLLPVDRVNWRLFWNVLGMG